MSKKFAAGIYLVLLLVIPGCRSGERISAGADSGEEAGQVITHRIAVILEPSENYIRVEDMITIPAQAAERPVSFLLAEDMEIISHDPHVEITAAGGRQRPTDPGMDREYDNENPPIILNRYNLDHVGTGTRRYSFKLEYHGKIFYPVEDSAEEYARSFGQSPGIISGEGVYLGGSTCWVPSFGDKMVRFHMTVDLPEGWDAVSQGKRSIPIQPHGRRIVEWDSNEPMEEIFLVAAEFTEYSSSGGPVEFNAFLRRPDEALAFRYIETTSRYLEMYEALVGPYPFAKFALVENFWETGYGMPSFTLLGEKVIRFPFILHSSYPHELLHNWWGNSVYVDFRSGNWCEGLTTYLADHLIKEQRGEGAQYRQSALERFTAHVNGENDFPLTEFHSRSDAATEAVGYGKSMMIWNMLRDKVGDRLFVEGLKRFYAENRFRRASFTDIRKSFEEVAGIGLEGFFSQWVERKGAPQLDLSLCEAVIEEGRNKIRFEIEQVQAEDPFELDIPVAIEFADTVEIIKVRMNERREEYRIEFDQRPLSVHVDPYFNIMRRLHPNESPPSLSTIFGARAVLIILPSGSEGETGGKYRILAEKWARDQARDIKIVDSGETGPLPSDRAVWIFGEENRYMSIIDEGMRLYGSEITENKVSFGPEEIEREGNSFAVAVRHPLDPGSVAVWLSIGDEKAVDGLSRKLPHYGKYSYLAFSGSEPENQVKGRWGVVDSPLFQFTDENSRQEHPVRIEPAKRAPLTELPPSFSEQRMMDDLNCLADARMEGRGLGTRGIEAAARYIADSFSSAGLEPGADDHSFYQLWEGSTGPGSEKGELRNIIGVIPGVDEEKSGEAVLICAHYDHLGKGWPDCRKGNAGKIHYGADDNASGVAVMLELARYFNLYARPPRTLVFAAFTAEEDKLRGSGYFVKNYRSYPPEKIIGVINLDTVGRLFGKKVRILDSSSAREWMHIFLGAGYVTGAGVEIVRERLDSSDQGSFIEAGVPAVQLFSGVHSDYHTPEDTPDRIDPRGMVSVASLAREAVVFLAGTDERLHFTGDSGGSDHEGERKAGRRTASTGSMPDFAFSGKGVRIAAVTAGSAAEIAGLREGDIITSVAGVEVKGVKEYSDKLKNLQPGDAVEFVVTRGTEKIVVTIILQER
ncbi:MAG: M20/M25/M40 family metallo-hydrolase [Candidatus Krumholzibacteriota bacterium]|nr:M20/M25/M40 family metallo-hydrolase [Candidatus Krumholzibacteriota bacterium]